MVASVLADLVINYTALMYSYSKNNNSLVPKRLIFFCYKFNQLKNCLNLYENEELFN